MERIINEIHEEDGSPKVEVDVKANEDSLITEQYTENSSDDEDEDEEENVEESQRPSPDAGVGDYVVIDRFREYDESQYRCSFTEEMVDQYGNKVLVVKRNSFDGKDNDYVEDDCHKYDLVDLYGRNVMYTWASSMFTRISSPEDIRQRTLEGFSRELLAFHHLLENYLLSPLKVGVYQSSKIYSIMFDGNSWHVESDCKGAIFNFPAESEAITFYRNNYRDFQVAGRLF